MNGELCPYVENAPETIEGHAAWEIAGLCVRADGMDASAALRMAEAQGLNPLPVVSLVGDIAAGVQAGLSHRRDRTPPPASEPARGIRTAR